MSVAHNASKHSELPAQCPSSKKGDARFGFSGEPAKRTQVATISDRNPGGSAAGRNGAGEGNCAGLDFPTLHVVQPQQQITVFC